MRINEIIVRQTAPAKIPSTNKGRLEEVEGLIQLLDIIESKQKLLPDSTRGTIESFLDDIEKQREFNILKNKPNNQKLLSKAEILRSKFEPHKL
jgi:hypothetical protein